MRINALLISPSGGGLARLPAYNTRESADDVADLIHALDLQGDKVALFGLSYGTHLALTVLRRHDRLIEKVILFGVEGPDHTIKSPQHVDRLLASLDHLADEADWPLALPPSQAVEQVLATFDVPKRISYTQDGQKRSVLVGRYDVEKTLLDDMGDIDFLRNLPGMIARILAGDYQGIAAFLYERRIWAPDPLYAAMECRSNISGERQKTMSMALAESVLTVPPSWPFPEICKAWKLAPLDRQFRSPVTTSVPSLLVSGGLDAQTPPSNAEEVLRGLDNGAHLVIEGVAHSWSSAFNRSPAMRQIVRTFLDGLSVRSQTLKVPFTFITP